MRPSTHLCKASMALSTEEVAEEEEEVEEGEAFPDELELSPKQEWFVFNYCDNF